MTRIPACVGITARVRIKFGRASRIGRVTQVAPAVPPNCVWRCTQNRQGLRNTKAMNDPREHDACWYVYLFALADCSAFKVGFSCNPFQRIHTFSRRYYERFDVGQSLLLSVGTQAEARAIEAALKGELAEFRTDSPEWVSLDAGGHTEWFSAVQFGRAEQRLRSFVAEHGAARVTGVETYIRRELERLSGSFEPWAWSQAQQACDASASPYTLSSAQAIADSLRDWLDAYRCFDVALFRDDPAVLEFVSSTARSSPSTQPRRTRAW